MRVIKFRFYNGHMIYPKSFLSRDLIEDDTWKVMQFTGRKDKNKKDIYRCDILRGKNGLWEVKWIDDNICGWNIRVEDTDMEIIGNRYENPELL